MKAPRHWYVYLHKTNNGDVFYCGKGQGGRDQHLMRNRLHNSIARKYGLVVQRIASFLNEHDAFEFEIELIRFYKLNKNSIDYVPSEYAANFTDGGEGPKAFSLKPEQIEKFSHPKTREIVENMHEILRLIDEGRETRFSLSKKFEVDCNTFNRILSKHSMLKIKPGPSKDEIHKLEVELMSRKDEIIARFESGESKASIAKDFDLITLGALKKMLDRLKILKIKHRG